MNLNDWINVKKIAKNLSTRLLKMEKEVKPFFPKIVENFEKGNKVWIQHFLNCCKQRIKKKLQKSLKTWIITFKLKKLSNYNFLKIEKLLKDFRNFINYS